MFFVHVNDLAFSLPFHLMAGTLFSLGFARKTATTSSVAIAAAAEARKQQEAADLQQLQAAAQVSALAAVGTQLGQIQGKQAKQYSSNPDAVRKRRERRADQARNAAAKQKEKSIRDAAKAAARAAAAADVEAETHYIDKRGRKRPRKQLRSRADETSARVGPKGNRRFTDTEKALIVSKFDAMQARCVGRPYWSTVAKELIRAHPTLFGPNAPGFHSAAGISAQAVRQVVLRHQRGVLADGRGRPAALPEAVILMIVAAFTSVVSARTTIVSAPMLQPIAIGIVIAQGYASYIRAGRTEESKKRGLFCCGIKFVRKIMKDRGWVNVRPQGDTRKLPVGWGEMRWAMVLRLAYFVFAHEIPRALVINADHTGIMFTQVGQPRHGTHA